MSTAGCQLCVIIGNMPSEVHKAAFFETGKYCENWLF